ncbi:MAG: hypothetical protein ACRDRN_16305 [Sciscionella sp.]
MSWESHYRRRDAIDAVLRHAEGHPHEGLAFAVIPQAREEFADEQELLLALHYKWTQILTGHLNVAFEDDSTEPVDAIGQAWRTAAARNPVLRGLLDAHLTTAQDPRLRAARGQEQRMLAVSAGLAEPHEPDDELTKVGAAYAALLRRTPERAGCHRPFAGLRKLVTSN